MVRMLQKFSNPKFEYKIALAVSLICVQVMPMRAIARALLQEGDETIKVNSQPKFAKKVSLVYEYDFQNIWVNDPIPAALFQIS